MAILNIRLLLVLMIAAANPTNAAVYKWVDEQGKVHFGDRPSAPQAQRFKLDAPPKSSNSTAPGAVQRRATRQRMLDMYQQEREKKQVARKKKKENAKKLAQQCANAHDQLRRYEGSQLYKNLPGGERRYLSETDREKTISKLSRSIKRYCK